MKHQDYTPMKIDPWGDRWRIFPVDGYGTQEMIRSVMQKEKPDILWFMTDPRFYGWFGRWKTRLGQRSLWSIIMCGIIFLHLNINGRFYRSNDEVACISKVTHEDSYKSST
jgi:hypothetical protein